MMAYYASIPTYIPPVVFSDDSYDFPAYQPGTSQLERSRSNRYVYEDDPWNSARTAGVLVPNPPLVISRGKRSKARAEQKPKKEPPVPELPTALKPGAQAPQPNAKLNRRLTFITNSTGSSSGQASTIEDIRATVDKTALFARLQLHLGDRSATLTVVSDQPNAPTQRDLSPRRGVSDPVVTSNRHSPLEPTKPHWGAPMPVTQVEPESVQRPLPSQRPPPPQQPLPPMEPPSANVWSDMNTVLSSGSGRRRPVSEQFLPRPAAYPSIASRLEPSIDRASFGGLSLDRAPFDRAAFDRASSDRASFDSRLQAQAQKERDMDVEDDFVLVEAHWKGPQKRDASRGRNSPTPPRGSPNRRPRSLTPQPRATDARDPSPLRPQLQRPETEPIIPTQYRATLEPPVVTIQSSTPPFPVLRLNDAPVDQSPISQAESPMPEIGTEEDTRALTPSPPAGTVYSHLSFGNLPEIPGSDDTHWPSTPGTPAPKPDSRIVNDVHGASDAIEAQIQNLYGELLGNTVINDENGEIGRRVVEDSRNATALILKALREQAAQDEVAEERSRAKGWRNAFRLSRRTATET